MVIGGLLHDLLYRGGGQGKGLGRRTPTNWDHVDKYPLRGLEPGLIPTGVPVAIGVNWYSDFDAPEKFDGRWWVARNGIRGSIRGGHCVCLKTGHLSDPAYWWTWFNQGQEGACVGFGCTRVMSLLNRKRYFSRWLWDWAKATDEWSDTNPGDDNGTSVHAAMEILRVRGHVPWSYKYASLNSEGGGSYVGKRDELPASSADGIAAYRWATTVDEVRVVLDTPLHDKLQAVPILNSWGRDYPHATWLPYTALERLIREDGEVALVTDR